MPLSGVLGLVLAFVLWLGVMAFLLLSPLPKRWYSVLQDRYIIFKTMRKYSHYEISASIHGHRPYSGCNIVHSDGRWSVSIDHSDADLPPFMKKIREELLQGEAPQHRGPIAAMDARGEGEIDDWNRIVRTSETARLAAKLLNQHFARGV